MTGNINSTAKNTKPQRWYLVSQWGRWPLHIFATDSNKAKREYCRLKGYRAASPFTGVTSLTARALTPAEAQAWEKHEAPALAATGKFIEGMLDIYARAHTEAQAKLQKQSIVEKIGIIDDQSTKAPVSMAPAHDER